MRPTAYLDLDGCLIDSRAPIAACIDEALVACGLAPLRPAEVEACIGPPIGSAFVALLSARGADPADAPACVARFRARYAFVSLRETTLVPGMVAALDALAARAALVVVTSKARHLAEPILTELGIRSRFAGVFGPAADALDEPKTVTLARALVGRARAARDAMIGDRRHDIEAGRALGVRAVGVTWGSGSAAELRAAGADAIIDTPQELERLFA